MNHFKKITLSLLLTFSFHKYLYPIDNHQKQYGLFSEWNAKTPNSKVDQIKIDPIKPFIIWFTQPNSHSISRFNSQNNILKEFKTQKIYRPDGLAIDQKGILWFGEQSSGTLGSFNPYTKKFKHYPLNYKKANPTIPSLDQFGNVWITDHSNNVITQFNPKKKTFSFIKLPNSNCWPVQITPDSKNILWYSCYKNNRIGFINPKSLKQITEYVLPYPKGGPSFLTIDSKNNLWFTLWNSNGIVQFNPSTETFIKYSLPIKNPGPAAISIDQNDIIYFSTFYLNSIIQFDPKNYSHFYSFQIPTPQSGQKDGIDIDKQNNIWFTQFDKNKFSRLIIRNQKIPTPKNQTGKHTLVQAKIFKTSISKKLYSKKYTYPLPPQKKLKQ